MIKSLDRKLAAIHADPNCREFILADAKDADMALGLGAPGKSPETHSGELAFKTLEDYRDQMRLITRQGLVDIMLMSCLFLRAEWEYVRFTAAIDTDINTFKVGLGYKF